MMKYFLVSSLLLFIGCSDSSGPAKNRKQVIPPTDDAAAGDSQQFTIGGKSFSGISAAAIQQTSSGVTGTGSLLSATASSAIKTENHFAFTGKITEGGSVKLVTFASTSLKSGVEVLFRVTSGKLKLQVGGKDLSSKLTSIAASGTLNIGVDVHNSEANPHVLVWVNASSKNVQTAVMNSEDAGLNLARGSGKNWGVEISGATLTAATIGSPFFEE